MESKIDIDKFICFLIENKSDAKQLLETCLRSQGLEYKDGEIVEIDQPPLTEEQKPVTTPGSYDKSLLHSIPKPQTIKFNKERLMEIAKPESIEEKYNINIEKMVKEYRESLNSAFLPLGYYPSQLNEFTKVYKNGIEDMLKLIKGGGE